MNRFRGLILLILMLLGAAAAAQPAERRMEVRLVPETGAVAPGSALTLAFIMRPRPGWHGYWLNPGDAGDTPRVAWRLPEGWRADGLRFPMPGRLIVAGLMNYVFERDYALLTRVTVPDSAEPGATLPIDARIDYLVCTNEVCVPETATVTANVQIGAPGAADPAFDLYRSAIPAPVPTPGRFETAGGRIRIALPLAGETALEGPYFYPSTLDAVRYSVPQAVSRSGAFVIVETDAGPRAGTLETIEGVLRIADGRGLAFTARRGDVPGAGTPIGTPPGESGSSEEGPGILWALLGAILGGLILNVMPCVFPILSLKALSLARAGESAADARREALAYAAGMIATCLALGAVLLAVRASGAMVGWAFQLQDPRVILVLLLLTTAIALGLAGLFQLPAIGAGEALTRRGGLAGAFFTGALAAFVATPCTGPFMGAALGAALVLPAAGAIAVFAGLGLGLALPFLLLGFVPSLRRLLPRPGPWMATFQRILSVPMFLTALGLAWVLGAESGVDGMAIGLGGALLLGLALWWLGRGGRWLALALGLAAILAPFALLPAEAPASSAAEGPLAAEPFSEARLAGLRAARTPVFVYFTADWCLTCKVNERGAMASAAVADNFRARGIKVLAGDWTRGDPAIGRFLESHGRSGVPLYLYYAPGRDVELLPQILTAGRLTGLN
jgi:DsbC/DsbD-like thiol-disulfide interchange protein/cytochrome c biogenesis protein CcdA